MYIQIQNKVPIMSQPSHYKETDDTYQYGTGAKIQMATKINQKDNPQNHNTTEHQRVAKQTSPSFLSGLFSCFKATSQPKYLSQSPQYSLNTRDHRARVEIDQKDTIIDKIYAMKQRLIQSDYQQLRTQSQLENPLDFIVQVQLKYKNSKVCLVSILLFKYQLVNYYYYQKKYGQALKLIDQCISMNKIITSKQYPLFNLLVYRFIIAFQLTINKNYYCFLQDVKQLRRSYNKILDTFNKDEDSRKDNYQKLFLIKDIIHYYYLERLREAQYEAKDKNHFQNIMDQLQAELPDQFIQRLKDTSNYHLTIRPNSSFCPEIVQSLFSRQVRSFEQQMVKNQSKRRDVIASEVQNLNKLKEMNYRDTFTLQQWQQQTNQNQQIFLWSYDQYKQVTQQIEKKSKTYKIKLPYYNLDSIYISNRVSSNWMVPFKAKKYVLIKKSQRYVMLKYMRGIQVCQKGSLNKDPSTNPVNTRDKKALIVDLQSFSNNANPYSPPSFVLESSLPTYNSRFEDFRGLPNIGNTGFMNGALQCLNNSTSFQKAFEDQILQRLGNYGSVGRLASTYYKLLQEMKMTAQKRQRLNQIKHIVAQSNPIFEGHRQNDSLQFFNTFIIILRQELNNSKQDKLKVTLQQKWEDDQLLAATVAKDQSRFLSVIEQNFTGRYKTLYTCGQCNWTYRLFEKFNVHYVPLPPPEQNWWQRSQTYDLKQCLRDAEAPDILLGDNAMTCDHCEQRNRTSQKTTRVIKIYQPNKILVIGLKRFHDGQKNDRAVKVPLTLSIEAVVPNGCYKKQYKGKKHYILYGAILHCGSLTGDHYTSICRDKEGQWRDYNDSHVREITQPQQNDLCNAYGLFYELQDIKESESHQRVHTQAIKTSQQRQQNSNKIYRKVG